MLRSDYIPPILGDSKILVRCPKCDHKTWQQYEHLKTSPKLVCSACEVAFTCDGEKLKEGLGTIGKDRREAVSESLKIVDPGS